MTTCACISLFRLVQDLFVERELEDEVLDQGDGEEVSAFEEEFKEIKVRSAKLLQDKRLKRMT